MVSLATVTRIRHHLDRYRPRRVYQAWEAGPIGMGSVKLQLHPQLGAARMELDCAVLPPGRHSFGPATVLVARGRRRTRPGWRCLRGSGWQFMTASVPSPQGQQRFALHEGRMETIRSLDGCRDEWNDFEDPMPLIVNLGPILTPAEMASLGASTNGRLQRLVRSHCAPSLSAYEWIEWIRNIGKHHRIVAKVPQSIDELRGITHGALGLLQERLKRVAGSSVRPTTPRAQKRPMAPHSRPRVWQLPSSVMLTSDRADRSRESGGPSGERTLHRHAAMRTGPGRAALRCLL